MKTSCLVNNYNYAPFVGGAVRSALAQNRPFGEIIVVDDGSTDGSVELLRREFANAPTVKLLQKENGGQLSAFRAGFAAASGELLFFLDADDQYRPEYLETALDCYGARPECDMLSVDLWQFGNEQGLLTSIPCDTDFGLTRLPAWFRHQWIGNATSAISMRREILERLLLLPDSFDADWRVSADQVLVLGASLAGGRKFHLARPLVEYRVHGNNVWRGRPVSDEDRNALDERRARLCAHYQRSLSLPDDPAVLAIEEFGMIPAPTFRTFRRYVKWVRRSSLPVWKRLIMVAGLCGAFARSRTRPLSPPFPNLPAPGPLPPWEGKTD